MAEKEYVEREAAKNALCRYCRDISNWRLCEHRDVCNYLCRLDGVPAADVREVKHGKWIEEEDGYDHVYYSCSVCGAGICTIDETPIEYGWKYCPECGSKMEELVRIAKDEEEQI